MKKLLMICFAALCLSVPRLSAQIGFDFGTNFEFMNRKAPEGFKATGFGFGPYVGLIYGIPLGMSDLINIGVNYKYDYISGAMGAWYNETKLDPITLGNYGVTIKEQHLQVPVTYNRSVGSNYILSVGPVFDYCFASSISSTHKDWPYEKTMDTIKDFGVKPFNVYLKAGAGVGLKGFSFKLTVGYGLLNLSPDSSSPLRRWTAGLDFHLNL